MSQQQPSIKLLKTLWLLKHRLLQLMMSHLRNPQKDLITKLIKSPKKIWKESTLIRINIHHYGSNMEHHLNNSHIHLTVYNHQWDSNNSQPWERPDHPCRCSHQWHNSSTASSSLSLQWCTSHLSCSSLSSHSSSLSMDNSNRHSSSLRHIVSTRDIRCLCRQSNNMASRRKLKQRLLSLPKNLSSNSLHRPHRWLSRIARDQCQDSKGHNQVLDMASSSRVPQSCTSPCKCHRRATPCSQWWCPAVDTCPWPSSDLSLSPTAKRLAIINSRNNRCHINHRRQWCKRNRHTNQWCNSSSNRLSNSKWCNLSKLNSQWCSSSRSNSNSLWLLSRHSQLDQLRCSNKRQHKLE